ncbi:hypothetical protein [Brevundimonas sp. TWP2-3-4b1]|uniref:hypothetical protein n=1 Tax=Brevundimonas sp. TWP2-3-4b1 TaxID=2804580 RepID=UPI003CECC758
MAVKITAGSEASNKPPVPEPSISEYPIQLTMADERKVWISNPQPDKLTLIAPLLWKHFQPQPKDEAQFIEYITTMSSVLATVGGLTKIVSTRFDKANKLFFEIVLQAGDRDAVAIIQFTKPKGGAKPQPWKLRIELNPRKIGPAGFKALAGDLSYSHTFRLARYLADAKITRLDTAVDFIGVQVADTLPQIEPLGKSSYVVGRDGVLETISLHRPAPPPKQNYDAAGAPKKVKRSDNPLGEVLVKVYDRVRERASVLQPAPFGPAEVTRCEVVKKWKGHGPTLLKLTSFGNPLNDVSLTYVNAAVPNSDLQLWKAYVGLRRHHPATIATRMLGLSIYQALAWGKLYNDPPSALITPAKSWLGWPSGLKQSGLDHWIGIAASAEFDLFEGGQT